MATPPRGSVYCAPFSTCSRRVLCTLGEVKADFKFKFVDISKGSQKEPWFLKIQPYGKVPVWIDESHGEPFTLYESRAIMFHLAEGTHLIPADVKMRALMNQWISIEQSYLAPAFMPAYYDEKKKAKDPAYAGSEEVKAKARADLTFTLDLMESTLSSANAPYLVGVFSLADLTMLCYFQWFEPLGFADEISKRPALATWWELCSQRESWKFSIGQEVYKLPAPDA